MRPTNCVASVILAGLIISPGFGASIKRLDENTIIRESAQIVKSLHKVGCKNVGVLNFRVQIRNGNEKFQAGGIGSRMAQWLQNGLVFAQNPADPIGVIDNASSVVAQKLPNANYRTADARQKLFSIKYPLAWGDSVVVPDFLLTGKVIVDKTTKIVIEAIPRSQPNVLAKVHEFEVKTDLDILAESGIGYTLSPRLARGMRFDRIPGSKGASLVDATETSLLALFDEEKSKSTFHNSLPENPEENSNSDNGDSSSEISIEELLGNGGEGSSNEPGELATPAGAENPYVQLTILYNGTPQTISEDLSSSADGELKQLEVPEPQKGDTVTFKVKNLTSDRLGVLLAVNNVNTLHDEKLGSADKSTILGMSRWILEPNKEYTISGFYPDSGTLRPIKIVETDDDGFSDLSGDENAGLITFAVMGQGSQEAQLAFSDGQKSFGKGLKSSRITMSNRKPTSVKEYQQMLASMKPGKGLMAASNESKSVSLQEDSLPNPVVLSISQIRYWRQ